MCLLDPWSPRTPEWVLSVQFPSCRSLPACELVALCGVVSLYRCLWVGALWLSQCLFFRLGTAKPPEAIAIFPLYWNKDLKRWTECLWFNEIKAREEGSVPSLVLFLLLRPYNLFSWKLPWEPWWLSTSHTSVSHSVSSMDLTEVASLRKIIGLEI